MKITETQRKYLYIAAAVAAAYLAYRWYANRQTSTSADQTGANAAPDTTSSDYAALAGQEQGDVAALQDQNSQLMSQEQSDVAALQAQEQADAAGFNQTVSGYQDQFDQLTSGLADLLGAQSKLSQQVSALAIGEQKVNRALHATVNPHPGGPFYRYYKQVTGHRPPAHISVSNVIYQAYKSGIKASALARAHPSAPRNRQVAHPNGDHTPKTGTHRSLSSKAKTPPKASKPRSSGSRREGAPRRWKHGTRW